MALTLSNYEYQGFNLNSVYTRIGHLQGNKNLINFNVVFYANKNLSDLDTRNEKHINVLIFNFTPDLNSQDNFIKQAYDYLKLQPEFSQAVDC